MSFFEEKGSKKRMKNVFLNIIILSASIFLLSPIKASAATSCQPIYGGGLNCIGTGEIAITKKVFDPSKNTFADSLGDSNPFNPNDSVTFQLIVTNTGQGTLSRVLIKDFLPQVVNFLAGPGNFDQNTKTLSLDVLNLSPNESRPITLSAQIVPNDQLPIDSAIMCVVNQASATIADTQQTRIASSQFCIRKQIIPGKQLVAVTPTEFPASKGGLKIFPPAQPAANPPTGPEAIPLIGFAVSGIVGFALRKITGKV